MCNKCDKINKYTIIKQLVYFDEAEAYCQDYIGTHLASIHSEKDMAEAQFLCDLYLGKECWICLQVQAQIDLFQWTDGSIYNYQKWNENEPNRNNTNGHQEYGVALIANEWFTVAKTSKQRHFLCSLPSEFCHKDQWNVMNGEENIKFNDCNIEMNGDAILVLGDKQWMNTNDELQIEYIYQLEYNTKSKGTGIFLFNSYVNDSICNQ